MQRAEQLLDEQTRQLVQSLAERLHQSPSKVLGDAVQAYATTVTGVPPDWKQRIKQAAGIWKDRTDLPDFEELRRSADRDVWKDRDKE